ncbi:cobalamin B12-binding domain-containing protein [Pseudotabrizicola formosa]|uniref:cobalamin B12-binding domain-containing protein n=1 Tax=Pseudotabrizicola formosa TaxID=2030009 RepID=UPI00143DC8F7|nr:cobalamin B12-binding domain-containing protein [Pseudotabrizicola formosa]
MQDGNFSVNGLRGLNGAGISQFAADVMARVASRADLPRAALKEPLLAAMMAAVKSQDLTALAGLRPDFRRWRISNDMLADHYIPELARMLGQEWLDDTATFSQVSIGCSRLQVLLHDVGRGWSADGTNAPGAATVLLIVPGNEQHTLGALVVAGWLRRKGISVCLRIAPTEAGLATILAQRRFDAAMISVAYDEMLEICTGLVKTLRQETSGALPIALGGAVLEHSGGGAVVSQVDIVTNDLSKAVEVLGLTCRRPAMTVIT